MSNVRDAARVTRRAAVASLAAGGIGFALWPYRPRSAEDIPPGRVVLSYWEKWTGPEGLAVQRVVDRFNASQDRIWVRRVPVSDIVAKSMVAIGGGDPPDIVGLFNFNIPQFAEAGAVLPLDDFTAAAELAQERYAPAVWKLLTHEGRCWAGVSSCYSLALYYNRGLFREAGLDPNQPPRTTDELDACAARLTRIDADGQLQRAGFLPNVPDWWPYFWPVMFGGSFYDADRIRATMMTPQNIAAYEWVSRYASTFGRFATRSFAAQFGRSFHSPNDPFLLGKVAMIAQGPWLANFIRKLAPALDYGCSPIPVAAPLEAPERPRGMLEADVLMIPRGCPHPEEAYEFLRFTQRADMQEQLATDHCKSSPLRDVSAGFTARHPNPYVAVFDRIVKSPAVQTAPPTRIWKQYADMIGSAFDAIWSGDPVIPQLQSVQDRAQELLDAAQQRRRQRRGRGGGRG